MAQCLTRTGNYRIHAFDSLKSISRSINYPKKSSKQRIWKKNGLFLFIILNERILHKEAGKENKQGLANLSPAKEATSKDEVGIEKFLQEQKSKDTQYKTIKERFERVEEILWVTERLYRNWKHTCQSAWPSFVQIFHLQSLNKMALSMSWVL